jgi:hypothetical protein
MFSFRSDKTGFFVTIILLVLLAAMAVSTLVILAVGGWEEHKVLIKFVWGTWWVLCILTVLIRLIIFRWQMLRAERGQGPGGSAVVPDPGGGPEGAGGFGTKPPENRPPPPEAPGQPGADRRPEEREHRADGSFNDVRAARGDA